MPDILKNKWVWIGGAVVFLIVMLMSGAKGGGTSVVSAGGPTDAEIAAQRDITIAQLSAQGQTNAAQAQIAVIAAQSQAETGRAVLEGELQRYAIDANVALQAAQLANSRDITMAQLQSDERREQTSMNAQTQIAKWTLDQASYMQDTMIAYQLDYAEAANATAEHMAQLQASIVNNQLLVSRDVTLAGLATQTDMAAINAALQRDVTYSNNAAMQSIYSTMTAGEVERMRIGEVNQTERERIRADVEKKRSSNNLFGNIIGGVLGLIF